MTKVAASKERVKENKSLYNMTFITATVCNKCQFITHAITLGC